MFTVCQHSFRYLFKFRCSALLGRGLACCWGKHVRDLNLSYLYSTRFAVTGVKAPLSATLEDPRELRGLWGQLHDLTVILCQNKTWLYTSSPPPPPLRSAAVRTGKKPRRGGQRGGTLWPSSWFGWTGDQDTAALCLAQLRHSLEDYKATGWNWSTRDSTRHLLVPSSKADWGREVTKFS